MEKDQQIYIGHILDAIDIIQKYAKGLEFEEFQNNIPAQNVAVRQLEIIGEASKRLPQEFKALIKEIPWVEVSAMRNKIAHDYFEVDLLKVWKTVEQDVPVLKEVLERHFEAEDKNQA